VTRFEPFAGVRYDPERVELADVVAPPYDVIDDAMRATLEARSPYNAARAERVPVGAQARDPTPPGCVVRDWLDQGVLVRDDAPGFYVYRMGHRDAEGRARQTAGVIGALALSAPGEDGVLPHERTVGTPSVHRLAQLRACRANLSPIWGLSPVSGLSALCELPGPPVARCTDDDDVHHRLWHITQPGVVDAIAAAVASAPVVIADGHHRYETALAYRDEQRRANGGRAGPYDLLMAYVVELTGEQLDVRPIHRLVRGLPNGIDVLAALAPWFDVFDAPAPPEALPAHADDAGALGLVLSGGAWLLRPRPSPADETDELDVVHLDRALATLPPHTLDYEPDVGRILAAVRSGEGDAGVLLRPVSLDQIANAARRHSPMPEKTSFFYPKPRTGLVFRMLD